MIVLKEHNVPVLEQLEDSFQEHNKNILITATGSGKSYVTAAYIEKYNLKTLVYAPKLAVCNAWKKLLPQVDTQTYKSLERMKDEFIEAMHYDLIVFDEAHHSGAEVWGAGVKRIMEAHPEIKFLGLTADPIRYNDGRDDVSLSVFDGNIVDGYSLEEAIEEGILPGFTYVTALYELDKTIDELKTQNKRKSKAITDRIARLELNSKNQ